MCIRDREEEAQTALEVEVEASNIEENQPDKPAYTENLSIQEMIRLMAEQLSKKMEDNNQQLKEELKNDSKQLKEQLGKKMAVSYTHLDVYKRQLSAQVNYGRILP